MFITDEWGYGTTTGALTVARALGAEVERCLAAPKWSLPLAMGGDFDAWLTVSTMSTPPPDELVRAVRRSDIVVSVLNPEAASLAAGCGVPCILVDLLLWMWDWPLVDKHTALRYFAEDFPGVREKAVRWHDELPPVHVIPPLVIPGNRSSDSGNHALVNFGGLSTSMTSREQLVSYACAMVECISAALIDWPGPITITLGPHVLGSTQARARPERTDMRFVSLSHSEYLQALDGSRLLVTSPGLHAVYEAFSRGIPCLLLPSQNLSQALTLHTFRSLRVAAVLDWEEIYGLTELTAADEEGSCARIATCFNRFLGDPTARSGLVTHLRGLLSDGRLQATISAQDAFFATFGGRDGGHQVADCILEILNK